MNSADRHARLTELFRRASELEGEGRDAFLREECREDPSLLEELRELLAASERSDALLPLEPAERPDSSHSPSELLERLSAHSPGRSRYRLRGEVARGGMGAILRVRDEDLQRDLAMKVILGQSGQKGETPPVDERVLSRFLEEAQITGQLDHPGVVPVHELGLDARGRVYFTMRLVKGEDFKSVIDRVHSGDTEWTLVRALGALLKACDALDYAHSKRVIHRDLKPANLMVGRFGEAYVMDWGLSKVLDREDLKDIRVRPAQASSQSVMRTGRADARHPDSDSPFVTMDGDIIGTPSYMSPEQARGELSVIGPATDIYALGAILYHLLSGDSPYTRGEDLNAYAVWGRVQAGPPEPVDQMANVAPELAAICNKAMAREVGGRYPSARTLADDLRAYLENRVVRAHTTGPIAELVKWVHRNRATAAALGLALAITLAGLIWNNRIEAAAARTQAQLNIDLKAALTEREDALHEVSLQKERLNDLVTELADNVDQLETAQERLKIEQAKQNAVRFDAGFTSGNKEFHAAANQANRLLALVLRVAAPRDIFDGIRPVIAATEDGKEKARLMLVSAAALHAEGRHQEALVTLDEVATILASSPSTDTEARLRVQRASALRALGRTGAALEELETAVGLFRDIGNGDAAATAQLSQVRLLADRDPAAAREFLSRPNMSWLLSWRNSDHRVRAEGLLLQASLTEGREALDTMAEAAALYARVEDEQGVKAVLKARTLFQSREGALESVVAELSQASSDWMDDPKEGIQLRTALANALANTGRRSDARRVRPPLEFDRTGVSKPDWAALLSPTEILREVEAVLQGARPTPGRLTEVVQLAAEARIRVDASQARAFAARCDELLSGLEHDENVQLPLAIVHLAAGNRAEAEKALERAAEWVASEGRIHDQGVVQHVMGRLLSTDGAHAEALLSYRAAQRLYRSALDAFGQSLAGAHEADTLRLLGRKQEAVDAYQAAAAHLEDGVRRDIFMEFSRRSTLVDEHETPLSPGFALVAGEGADRSSGLAKAYECLQWERAAWLRRHLGEVDPPALEGASEWALRGLEQSLREGRIASRRLQQARALSQRGVTSDLARRDSLAAADLQATARKEQYLTRLRGCDPLLFEAIAPRARSVAEVQSHLPVGAALIEYAVADTVVAFVVTQTDVRALRLGSFADLRGLLDRALPEFWAASDPEAARRALHPLSETLLGQVLGTLDPGSVSLLLFAADDSLVDVPFFALPTSSPGAAPTFLAESFHVARVHSGSVLVALRERGEAHCRACSPGAEGVERLPPLMNVTLNVFEPELSVGRVGAERELTVQELCGRCSTTTMQLARFEVGGPPNTGGAQRVLGMALQCSGASTVVFLSSADEGYLSELNEAGAGVVETVSKIRRRAIAEGRPPLEWARLELGGIDS